MMVDIKLFYASTFINYNFVFRPNHGKRTGQEEDQVLRVPLPRQVHRLRLKRREIQLVS